MPRFQMYPLRANSILQLYEWKDQINLDPPYQRLSIWDRTKKQCFIDSVLNGFDIPKLYFHQITPPPGKTSRFKYAVIDGKQRLLALWDFKSNNLRLSEDFVFFEDEKLHAAGASYDDLMLKFPRLRARFDSFDVPITVVQTDDSDFIEELFGRLNIQMSLSGSERRNAFGGPLPYIIRKIGVHEFFTESISVANDRLQHFDLAAKFLYLTRADAIESTKRKALNEFVTKFREYRKSRRREASPEQLTVLESNTTAILDTMKNFFESKDRLLASQGRTILYFHIFRMLKNANLRAPFTREMLAEFNEEVEAARKKSQRRATGSEETITDLEQTLIFFDREKQSPNDGGAIKRQYDYMSRYFVSVFKVELPRG